MTELIKQYHSIKAKYPDAIVLFRIGNYYEAFGDDAVIVAKQLSVPLTAVTDNSNIKATARLPFQSVDIALQKLVKAGYRVAICDQLEEPKMAKGIIKRSLLM